MVMVLSARLQHSQQQQQALARELAEQLQACGSGADAAQLLVQLLGDVDGAVAALVAAKEWREALRVAYAGGRQDLVDTTVVPGAAQVGWKLNYIVLCCCGDTVWCTWVSERLLLDLVDITVVPGALRR